jgi:hypothetical protein
MFRETGNWSQTHELLNPKRFRTHGQMINHEDAHDPKIGLTVEYFKPDHELWHK